QALGAVAPEDDVGFLEDVVGRVGVAEEREDVGEQPPLMLGHQPDELGLPLHATVLLDQNNGWRTDLTREPDFGRLPAGRDEFLVPDHETVAKLADPLAL